jgi:6-phosphogluconolactonase
MSNIERISSEHEWLQACFEEIKSTIQDAENKVYIGLSGGSTPVPIYKKLSTYLNTLPGYIVDRIKFFIVDERNVPLSSDRSNSRMILEIFGDKNVYSFDPTQNKAENYSQTIVDQLGTSVQFDLVVLGCGEDGHTASLFPNTALLLDPTSGFKLNELPTGELRFSLTFPTILGAKRQVVFVNNNAEKLSYFTELALEQARAPIHKITQSNNAKVIMHEAV